MKRCGVRPSVRPSKGPQQQTRCCRFAAGARLAGDIDRCSSGVRRLNAGSGTLSAYAQTAEHRLVRITVSLGHRHRIDKYLRYLTCQSNSSEGEATDH